MSGPDIALLITAAAICAWILMVGIVDVIWRAEIQELQRQIDEIKKARNP